MDKLNVIKKFVITGSSSGIGRYIKDVTGGIGITRGNYIPSIKHIRKTGADIIFHCAANSEKNISFDDVFGYVNDNIFLTRELVKIPHGKFIFFSTAEVYPKNNKSHGEREDINLNDLKTPYAITKLISEAIIREYSKNYLILRCANIVGKYSKKTTIMNLLMNKYCDTNIAPNSEYNIVSYADIYNFVEIAVKKNLKGTFNLASSKNISACDIANLSGCNAKFGDYLYKIGSIENKNSIKYYPGLRKTSKDVLSLFLKETNQ